MARNAVDVAQAVLTAFDTSMSKAWREEDELWHTCLSDWRSQDVEWMKIQRGWWLEETEHLACKQRWREEDMMQRNLENARSLWLRFVERNRRDVEEKSEQLKAISSLAAIFAGFAIVTLTQFTTEDNSSEVLVGIYGILTALVEGLMAISMVTCTLILGSILTRGKTYVNEQSEEEFIFDCLTFCQNFQEGDRPPCPKRTLEAFWESRCESSWLWAFHAFSLGVSAFLLSLIIIGWIKYSPQSKITATIFVLLLGIAIFIWCMVQYSWGAYLRKRHVVHHHGEPFGGYAGLPYDWYLVPKTNQTEY